jgi:hypothetical protein
LTPSQIDQLAEALGVARRNLDDEQLFAACMRVIRANMGQAL